MDPVVAEYLREKAGALRRHQDAVRTDVPDSVHQARVAVRKIRSALRVFAADEPGAGSLGSRLQEWGRVLGRARDAEVFRELLRTRVSAMKADDAGGPEVADLADRLDGRLADEYERARTAVVELLDTPGHVALLADLDAFIGAPGESAAEPSCPAPGDPAGHARDARRPAGAVRGRPPASDEARRLVAAARSARKRFVTLERKAGQRTGTAADVAWHRARRAAKRARYAAELVADAVPGEPGRKARDHAKRLKKVQSHLGARQDDVALRDWLEQERSRAKSDGEDLAPYDTLLAAVDDRSERSRPGCE
ncbi:CHAD domain-containing protein [Myceligenerans pegani]|uniref:CHAD domain-containing protein n=1 Tax=Myceligenerans pegani TaxID=2776917 RepID=A0ABR9N2X4_9MICO|nr:CHAD domain-containing protein [Myceligenerans sp. TRM 65318]MBE1877705.1 CHAD domain-containing protein [Myceligenerans sp. TRM 65318]MBE3019976.1 CHAD domain-containing protein [Myceligenerans sp. TRM 65318]